MRLAITQFPTIGAALGALQLALSHSFGELLGDPAFPARIDVRSVLPDQPEPLRTRPSALI